MNLVGDKLRQVFEVKDIGIGWFDEKANLLHQLYVYEHGQRLSIPPYPPETGGIFETISRTRMPLTFSPDHKPEDLNVSTLPGTDQAKSIVSVPIISSDRVLGLLNLENHESQDAFGEPEVRLLTTIAASLGTALENARLFDETQRLLSETERRSNELAILNSVGEAMAKTLDVKTITRIVGDKVRDIFDSEVVGISLFDEPTNMIISLYEFDKGEGGYLHTRNPIPLGTGLSSRVISIQAASHAWHSGGADG